MVENESLYLLELLQVIKKLKSEGSKEIDIDNLIQFMEDSMSKLKFGGRSIVDLEFFRVELQKQLETVKHSNSMSAELFKATVSYGQNALRALFLMHGGASVAMLAFIGHLTTSTPEKVHLFSASLMIFVTGVLVSVLVTGTSYLSQWFFSGVKPWEEKAGYILNWIAIIFGVVSCLVFVFGIYTANKVFTNFT